MRSTAIPATIDEYIAGFPPDVRSVLETVRSTIRAAAPEARERISYRMPAFDLEGIVVYFAAFTRHIGMYPPVSGDAALERALAPYAGPRGNLRFPYDRPIPYGLITRIVTLKVKQNLERAEARRKKKR